MRLLPLYLAAACAASLPLHSLQSAQADMLDRYIIADFEDVGTWRARPVRGTPPEAWFSGNMLMGASTNQRRNEDYVGELKYLFEKTGPDANEIALERVKMSRTSAFIDAIEFQANANGEEVSLVFDLVDSTKRTFRTTKVPLAGHDWKTMRLDVNADTVPDFAELRMPAVVDKIRLLSDRPGSGKIYMDDLTLVGRVSPANKINVFPRYTGLAHEPGKPVELTYRLRNAAPEELQGELTLEVRDYTGGPARTVTTAFTLRPTGDTSVSVALGVVPQGSYSVQVKAVSGGITTDYLDFFAVFTPNGGRINRSPMWFGIQDQFAWQGEAERALHIGWARALGIDMTRFAGNGYWLEPVRGQFTTPEWVGMVKLFGEADIDVAVCYSGVPEWTRDDPAAWKGPPTDYAAFAEHAGHVGHLLAGLPPVKYLEFWNEPDLEFFSGTTEDYLKMLATFGQAFKAAAPDIKILTGGMTIKHPSEKPGFSKAVIQRPDLYDIAAFHSHGTADDYAVRHNMVEDWLAETGEVRPLANTEAGSRSGYDVPGALSQAITLVQKITYAKSRANSVFYSWFILQDYWDMDAFADDSLGLVTSDNRTKPSFVAYNELIRRLANTEPAGTADLHPDLRTYVFRSLESGRLIYVCWPRPGRSSARFWAEAGANYIASDLFGRSAALATSEGPTLVTVSRLPMYFESTRSGDELKPVPAGRTFFDVPEAVVAGREAVIPVVLRNLDDMPGAFTASVTSESGEMLGRVETRLPAGGNAELKIPLNVSISPDFGSEALMVALTASGREQRQVAIPLTLQRAYPVMNTTKVSPDQVPEIVIERADNVHELVYDPFRPAWRGPEDLSARARFTHDGQSLFMSFDVTDSEHVQTQAADSMWKQDSVQIAFQTADGTLTELTLGLGNTGPAAWCSLATDASLKGAWDVPVTVTRSGKVTSYRATLPLARLGLETDAEPTPFRFSFVVNNDNGQGRVRVMQWFSGIALEKNPGEFGFGSLE